MHNRQSGAATVSLMFFLLVLVLFLGAAAFAYTTQTKNGELTKALNAALENEKTLKNKQLLVDHYIEDIGKVVGKLGKYEGRQGSTAAYQGATLTSPGVMNPAEVKALMDKAMTDAGLSAASSLENVFTSLNTSLTQMKQRVTEIESERDKALTEKSAVDKQFQTATAEAATKARDYAQATEQLRSDYDASKLAKDTTISQLNEGLRAKAEELTSAREEASKREKDLRVEINKRDIHNSALIERDRMRNPPDVADGKIIVSRQGVPTAYINLGRKDLLQPGTVFRVKNPNNPNVKGYATVKRVEEERAEVTLANFTDPIGDYAREGDLLFNDLFTPRFTRTIYLMGRFSAPYNKPELTNLLKRLGNKVVDKMGPGVDTVILGSDPVNEAGDGFSAVAESEEYKEAHRLNVEFTYLRTIRDLIAQ